MNDKLRRLLRLAMLAVFVVSTFLLLRQWLDNSSGSSSYDNALSIATQTEPTSALPSPVSEPSEPAASESLQEEDAPRVYWAAAAIPEDDEHLPRLKEIDISALQAVNPDVLGWIFIPDSKINYPLLQGEDNDYYLKHTWEGSKNSVGSIFLEHRNDPDFLNFNTIIYGHNMNDGSMFADVSKFQAQWFYDWHPYIYIVLPEAILRYEVFSAYKAPIEGQTYGLSFNQEQTKVNFLNYALENSTIETDVQPQTTDRIITLSTCTGNGYSSRWVAHARLEMIPIQG